VPSYGAYGIVIDSDVVIPELGCALRSEDGIGSAVRARLNVRRPIDFDVSAAFVRVCSPDGGEWFLTGRCAGGYFVRLGELADFFVSEGGDRIECSRTRAEILPETLRHLLLDAVIPNVLDLTGIESIHATAVLTEHGACAFIAPSGGGKSTLAASFALAGYPLLGDDCIALSVDESGEVVLTPGYPGTRLWNDSLDALRIDPAHSRPIAGYNSKLRALDLPSGFTLEPRPLRRIFRLSRDGAADSRPAAPRIESFSPAEAFIQLTSASYRFNPTDRAANLRQFRFMDRVAAKVPLKRLVVPNDFAALPAVRELVLADLSGGERDGAESLEVR
jgi:hypothetical protein